MSQTNRYLPALLAAAALGVLPASAQSPAAPPVQGATVQTTTEEVLLDMIVRDKKGKPITDLKPEDLTVTDNGAKQTLTSFRLVSGSEAVSSTGSKVVLDPLRQLRLVTLAFDTLPEIDQRKLARGAAIDLIKGDQGNNVFYSVVVISSRLLVLQPFTKDKDLLTKAIERATEGLGGPKMATESDAILAELKRNLGPNTAGTDANLLGQAVQTSTQTIAGADAGTAALQARLASVMLDMLRFDQSAAGMGTRLTLTALRSLVDGLKQMPGRKSVLYFTAGMYLGPELDVPFRTLLSNANRDNVTFYSVDTRGVMTSSQNAGAMQQLNGATQATATDMMKNGGATTKDEVMAADNAETSGRANVQLALRDLAEATGGFLIGDSNDLRTPLRHVNEEISSYYEVSFNPGIANYDGSFHKLAVVAVGRKDMVIHARNGYFALSPEARASGLQAFEMPLLKAISDGKVSDAVHYRALPVLLQPKDAGTDVLVLIELPLHELQSAPEAGKATLDVHCSLGALVKNAQGEVVQKLTRDRSFQVTPDQLKMGHFLDRMAINAGPGTYTLESAVMDRASGKIGMQRVEFQVPAKAKGVGISSITSLRSYTPNAKGIDPNDPFQFQGGSITPTLDFTVKKTPDAMLRLFFTVYQDPSVAGKPSVEVEFLQGGRSLTKVPMDLPAADSMGRIPYVMTIPAAAIPPGEYEVRARATQGGTTSVTSATIRVEAM